MPAQRKSGVSSGGKSLLKPAVRKAAAQKRVSGRDVSHAKKANTNETIGFLLWDARRVIARDFEKNIAPHGVSRSLFWILRILWTEDGLTQTQLIQRCRMRGPTIVGIVAQLEREGLVTRAADPNDSRKKVISLTARGSELRHVILPIVEDVNKRATRGLTATERNHLKEMLRRMRDNMEQV